jgi:hypothetical protein
LVSAPGVPLSWPLSWLNPGQNGRLFHEPLAAGTASMFAGLYVEAYEPEFGEAFPSILPPRKSANPFKKDKKDERKDKKSDSEASLFV